MYFFLSPKRLIYKHILKTYNSKEFTVRETETFKYESTSTLFSLMKTVWRLKEVNFPLISTSGRQLKAAKATTS